MKNSSKNKRSLTRKMLISRDFLYLCIHETAREYDIKQAQSVQKSVPSGEQ